ncbi:MAG: Mur ligase family protein, partial [bacterium]|nr:Mur ligase family protein [bacterium]
SRFFNVGSGSTWPGHIKLNINKNFIKQIVNKNSHLKIILITGTNGKTTTSKLIRTILDKNKIRVIYNESGANLVNGIASVLIQSTSTFGKINASYAIFEIDENTLPLILKEIKNPDFVIILNLFRDQLDRYGEINTIANKWKDAIRHLPSETKLILNADDPQIAYLASHLKGACVKYFGIYSKNKTEKNQHASDSIYCPNCGEKLIYISVYFSHLGNWECKKCGYNHPTKIFTNSPVYPLVVMYNEYNTNVAVLITKQIGISEIKIKAALQDFKPAFGRQETLDINGKKVQIFLSKNPTSFNESLRTIASLKAKNLLIVLNDRVPDGRDISWIWDVDFEDYVSQFKNLTVSGDRAYEIGLRLKYAEFKKFEIKENLTKSINIAVEKTPKSETLYILPTYSAMLEVRKILTGKKIL